MAEAKNTRESLAKLKRIIRNSPQVEQDITKWYDLVVTEIEPGEWKMIVNDEKNQVVYFSYYELSIGEIKAAQGLTEQHPKATEFQPVITIDSPRGTKPGPLAGMSVKEVRKTVEKTVADLGLPGEPIQPEPTLNDRVRKVFRLLGKWLRL
jgi:hypothetical protein